MRLAYTTFLVGVIAFANSATAECGCANAAGGHGYGYGGYNCDFPSTLWQGFCEQPSCCCSSWGSGFKRFCGQCRAPNYVGAGSGTWWYGFGAEPCFGCGCGCGCGCGGRYGLGAGGGLFQGLTNKWAKSSWCGGGCMDNCGLVGGCGDCGCSPSTIGSPTPAYGETYTPQYDSSGQNNTFYESQPTPSENGSGTQLPERLPMGTDDA